MDTELQIVELLADLSAAWKQLSDAQQEVLALAIFEQLDAESAAAALGIRPGTYRVRLSRARSALRTLLADTDTDTGSTTPSTPKAAAQEAR